MIFSELYNVYYNAVAKILAEAVAGTLDEKRLNEIVEKAAFGESFLTILPALKAQKWQLLHADLSTPLRQTPTMPLTELEKRWLKAISLDRRIRLFDLDFSGLEAVEPLFTEEDYIVYDQYNDGDPYEDAEYIAHFRLALDAIRNRYPLHMVIRNRHGVPVTMNVLPETLEYSEKDDKFRIIARASGTTVINVARILSCERYRGGRLRVSAREPQIRTLVFDVTDERNALERTMLHFAHFEKQTERIGENLYRVTLNYNREDETELVIRILSFGPKIRVVAPESFIQLIKERLIRQKSCDL
ncbi:MAG: WYL domain-containing protein [Clostridia bacterium]|nr:WYL domain-containing protein [Clostridia bacterium]